jgi:hypothetical protein
MLPMSQLPTCPIVETLRQIRPSLLLPSDGTSRARERLHEIRPLVLRPRGDERGHCEDNHKGIMRKRLSRTRLVTMRQGVQILPKATDGLTLKKADSA